jgi:hypothetical protein
LKNAVLLKGNTALESHVLEFGYFGLKKFVHPDLLCKVLSVYKKYNRTIDEKLQVILPT